MYKLKGKNIVKSDFEIEYTPEDYTNTLKDVETKLKELEAQQRIYIAKKDNVARNHPHVLNRTEEERNAIWLYQENFVAEKQAEVIIKQLKKDIKDVKKEMKDITEQTGLKF
jgi:hypothetical protein